MKLEEANKIIQNALAGYIEDCAGADSPEAKLIKEAWDVLKKVDATPRDGKVKIRIVAEVTTEVKLEQGETVDDLKTRLVDIYLHGYGENGHMQKIDLGGDAVIEIIQ